MIRPHFYECLYFEQSVCKTKMEWKEGLWLSNKESRIEIGWVSNTSAINARGTSTLVGMFNFQHVVGHHWHFGMGVGLIPPSAWAWLEKDDNLVVAIWVSRIAYAKPFKVAWGIWGWTLESNKCNRIEKKDTISKSHNLTIIHGPYICILKLFFVINIVCIF